MNNAARRVVASGRHGDDTLLHVSRKELEGIERLVGRPLTYNPETGLPEAFSWTDVIPIVAGIAGTVLSGGNPLIGAAASGLASGAVSAAEGESMETALTKGLVSGVTSYAGGQLLSGVGGAAGAAAEGAVAEGIKDVAGKAITDATGEVVSGSLGNSVAAPLAKTAAETAGSVATGANGSFGNFVATPVADAAKKFVGDAATGAVGLTAPPAGLMAQASANFDAGVARAGNIINNPATSAAQFAKSAAKSPQLLGIAGLGTYAQMTGALDEMRPEIERDEYDPRKYPEQFAPPRTPTMPGAGYRPGFDPEFKYFAQGGVASFPMRNMPRYDEAENVMAEARAAMLGEHPARGEAMSRLRDRMGPDTVRAVRQEAGRVRGAGGGLDDLVPGTIEGRQRVRLADGEFVVPSDVVSALGDGSTDQGARKLHEMMSRVRQVKSGNSKQPGRISRSVMPA